MKLTRFRVQDFRCFIDSRWVDVATDLTPIVGKNESGKSALLVALARLGRRAPAFDRLDDWPASKGQGEYRDNTTVVTAEFELDDDEVEGSGLKYLASGTRTVSVSRDHRGIFSHEIPGVSVQRPPKLFADLRSLLGSIEEGSEAAELTKTFVENWSGGRHDAWLQSVEQLRVSAAENEEAASVVAAIDKHAEQIDKIRQFVFTRKWLELNRPTFSYFDSYELVPGELNLSDWVDTPDDQLTEEQRRFELLAELSGLDLSLLANLDTSTREGVTERKQRVRDASLRLSGYLTRLWTQRTFETSFDIDADIITVYVKDDVEREPTRLDQRSAGFRWFYSFYVLFAARAAGTLKNTILLLDEPGTRLHGRAQDDLVRVIRELAGTNQILYTTHSPFMLDPDRLDDVRVVEEDIEGSRVLDSIWAADRDSSFPAQLALGFDIARLHFASVDQVLVEGVSDYYYIESFRRLLQNDGAVDPLSGAAVIPATGASGVRAVATVSLGQGHRIRVVFDDDREGRERAEELVRSQMLPPGCIAHIRPAGKEGLAIEDVLGDEMYKNLVRLVYATEISATGKAFRVVGPDSAHPHIALRVEAALKSIGVTFNKTRVARHLLADLSKSAPTIKFDKATRAQCEALLDDIAGLKPYERKR